MAKSKDRHGNTAEGGKPLSAASVSERMRVDKWLWQARFFKSRSLAAALCESGHLRINGEPITRASREVKAGDTLTFPQGRQVRLVRVLGTGVRRGPASEAQTLFLDLDLQPEPVPALD